MLAVVVVCLISVAAPAVTQDTGFTSRPTGVAAHAHLYKIGLLLPLSGKHKRLGEAALEAATMAQVEGEGPELVVVDTEGTVAGARAAVEKLAADPAVLVALGPIGWRVTAAAGQRAEELGLALVGLAAQEGLEHQGRFVFRGRLCVEEQARLMAKVGVEELSLERFAILHPDDELGLRAAKAFFEEVRKRNGRVTAWASYEAGETNLNKGVEELVAKRVPRLKSKSLAGAPAAVKKLTRQKAAHIDFDAIFVPDYDDGAALAAKFMRFHDVPLGGLGDGSSLQVLGTSQLHGPRLVDAEGLLAGALYPEVFEAGQGTDAARVWSERFAEAHEREPSAFDAKVYDLYTLLARVVVGAESKTGGATTVREQMPGLLIELEPAFGMSGLQWFEPDGRPGHRLEIWVVDVSGGVSPSF
jgi:ABC-type branched-subunit amino acid transport system substrate-binding protein